MKHCEGVYILRLDLKKFFPDGQWERMTQEERAAWKKKWEALQKRERGRRALEGR